MLINGTSGGILDATRTADFLTLGNTRSITSGYTPYSGSTKGTSIYFDGISPSALRAANSNNTISFGLGDFTVETWVYQTSNTGAKPIASLASFAASGNGFALYSNTGAPAWVFNGTAAITGTAISANSWNHIAVVRSSGTTKMYVNGLQTGATAGVVDSTYYGPSGTSPLLYIGTDGANYYTGYMTDVRFTKYARYTSNNTTYLISGPYLTQ